MSFQETPFSSYCWESISAFRADIKKYQISTDYIRHLAQCTDSQSGENVSQSVNSGYVYVIPRLLFSDILTTMMN
jgi:hypothetical protein